MSWVEGCWAEEEGQADSQLSRYPDTGLHPRIPGARLEPKADAQPSDPSWCPGLFNEQGYGRLTDPAAGMGFLMCGSTSHQPAPTLLRASLPSPPPGAGDSVCLTRRHTSRA